MALPKPLNIVPLNRSYKSFSLLWFFLLLLGPQVLAEPLRVVLPPVPWLRNPGASEKLSAALALFLEERVRECPSLRRVSPAWAQSILDELKSGKRDSAPDAWLEDFSRYVAVDVLVDFEVVSDKVQFHVRRNKGSIHHEIPFTAKTDIRAVVHQAASLLASDLGLPQEEARRLTESRLGDPAAFEAYYVSQVTTSPWPLNSGEAQLMLVRPAFDKHPEDALLASQVFRSVDLLLSSRNRQQDFAKKAIETAPLALVALLGTPEEVSAHALLRQRPQAFEDDLLALAAPLIPREGLEDGDQPLDPGVEGGKTEGLDLGIDAAASGEVSGQGGPADRRIPPAKRLGALRLLGVIRSSKGLNLILAAAKQPQAVIREAAAAALGQYTDEQSLAALKILAEDADPAPAFAAAYNLWLRNTPHASANELARKMLDNSSARRSASSMLAATAQLADLPSLRKFLEDPDEAVCRLAWESLFRLRSAGPDDFRIALAHFDDETVLAALRSLPEHPGPEAIAAVQGLANNPFGKVAEASRLALAPHRPASGRERNLFDLAIEHPYRRRQILEGQARSRELSAIEDLKKACENPNPHTRTDALALFSELSPKDAIVPLFKAIRDPYRWVRLHAAARLAVHPELKGQEMLREALASEKDVVIRLYLEEALAAAEGKPPAPPRPPARAVKGPKNLTWLCGAGLDSESSPFDAYYCLGIQINDAWKKASRAGKIFFARVENVGNPGLIAVDPYWGDRFWLLLDATLTEAILPYLDGVVFGEESMSADPDALWPHAWRLFCLDAGIDPLLVRGELKNLSRPESGAWREWAQRRIVEGFNQLYDYMHLKFGKLRPGLQVCTFLPEQGGANPADLRWKFDVGGLYDYKGCNRMAAYNMVRRYKTLWRDRPIIWLSLGIGGYEMNPVKRTQDVPRSPLFTRRDRAWSDAISAYIAGADTGWFSTWIFVDKDFRGSMADLRGVQILVEDIAVDSPALEQGILYAFSGAEEEYKLARNQPSLDETKLSPGEEKRKKEDAAEPETEEEDQVELALTGEASEKEKIARRVESEKARMRRGFLFYRNYVYDCARVLGSLPRQNVNPPALAIQPGVSIWSVPSTPNPEIPGLALFNAYDFLTDVNLVSDLDLSRYRLILAHDPGLLKDSTIQAMTSWLKELPGLLYVHKNLTSDNAAEASTPEDHDGLLRLDWPWEKAVTVQPVPASGKLAEVVFQDGLAQRPVRQARVGSTFGLTGDSARGLLSFGNQSCLVLWRDPSFKGAVLFDGVECASAEYLQALRKILHEIHETQGIGVDPVGPVLHQRLEADGLLAAATTSYYAGVSDEVACPGVDLLTGEANPRVGRGRSGTITARDFVGKYVASNAGLVVLSETPLEKVERAEGGLLVQARGLFRAASETGSVQVARQDGSALPEVKDPEGWIAAGSEEGAATLPVEQSGSSVTYVRCGGPVTIRHAPRLQSQERK